MLAGGLCVSWCGGRQGEKVSAMRPHAAQAYPGGDRRFARAGSVQALVSRIWEMAAGTRHIPAPIGGGTVMARYVLPPRRTTTSAIVLTCRCNKQTDRDT